MPHAELVRPRARRLAGVAFGVPGIDRVEIHHDPANHHSGPVPRSSAFTRVGRVAVAIEAPAKTGHCAVWRVHRPDWATAPRR